LDTVTDRQADRQKQGKEELMNKYESSVPGFPSINIPYFVSDVKNQNFKRKNEKKKVLDKVTDKLT
jgi:hypothetical protein